MELSGCKALLLAALIVASSRLLHGPAGCSAASAGSPLAALPASDVGSEEGETKQPGNGEALPFPGRGARACFPAGAVGRFHQVMLVVLLARGGGRMAVSRWRSSRRRG
ncbi:hypothetical protein C2845_PM01G30350 [Panicum miliaceum]|uniref:Uncharacterized protein n=1 Tax=Panicum miliaceum TaxID=4540 RepID=A0A3L6TI73_PANMI|nr:hypothetical protein C2845_PM01G30350 [Panicum miliaceum]